MNTDTAFEIANKKLEKKKKYIRLKPWTFVAIIVLVVVLFFASLFFYTKKSSDTQSTVLSEEEIQDYTKNLSTLMIVPEEEPAVFVVSDVDELIKQQAFFKDALNGDVLFIFAESAKAIIYSPSRNIVVNSGPVSAEDQENQIENISPQFETNTQIGETVIEE